ncbi:bifunctional diaminohydroxyphosphoribosylaminopyrimidine deaminase/5-amino-6-(5-phosphoribosylamino)uracil reductase RibD [Aquabacterium sp. OR-4]|uniref:bifunctional diaminohydroxyphosphoribosylaminopyrimidine deaminase/5-amino-6-(5-phosphoribosylamino)uracil reductase RibD n=1 Tax=Aquabacterium sp. OR-4 TaxID=2978127 RepID=UPI0028C8E4EB|nr:bifunctional diaminohydroxyphosphoribosylaminopyrimidine deaminase/5-amino-6-(5-phosphoribosylamino)uracil reductase RibD [Aquabacterium sp. OR-4]MDT7836354.1 bifunctional diaminohydroxyphosphoribosylaminopyrimidine deaminase/5-amino-6-(5-phosphoribosylamino)uracil reductase RibD [Aquabacterium sp. OR-4]
MTSLLSAADHCQLLRSIELAEAAIGLSEPNPRVGCVLHDAHGRLVGDGHTQHAGGPHAEVMALRAAQSAGADLRGGTAWVSLEPCAHHGRTPPCAEALVAAGIARVVVALQDPYPQVAGRGIALLRAAGVQVDLAEPGPVTQAAQALNIGFLSRVQRGRPWVRMKLAASLDGRTALPDGSSQWITGPAARADGQAWRRRASAVLTGIGTVRDDDPRLDVREWPIARQPRRVILDSGFATPATARILTPPGDVLVVGAAENDSARQALHAVGARTLRLPAPDGRVDLPALLQRLAEEGVNELHIEAGATLNGAWLAADLVDELLLYLAPKLLGPGRDLAAMPVLAQLAQARPWRFIESSLVQDDLRVRLRREGRDDFLR